MPQRSYNKPDVTSNTYVRYIKISGSGSPPANPAPTLGVQKRVRGEYQASETLEFNKRKSSGDLIPFGFYTKYDFEADFGSKTYYGTNKGPSPKYRYEEDGPEEEANLFASRMGTLQGSLAVLDELSSSLNVTALHQKALANIAPNLDILTTMAELPKTIAMITGIRKRAYDLVYQAIRNRRGVKSMASAYLEWRYGWRILGYDIKNFNEFWHRPFQGQIVDATANSGVKHQYVKTADRSRVYCSYTMNADITHNLDAKVHAAVKYSGKNLAVLYSPLVTAWELIPASFVADWAFSVGDAIQAWQVILRSEAQQSSIGYKLTEEAKYDRTNPVLGTGGNAVAPFGTTGHASSRGTLNYRMPLGSVSLIPQNRLNFTIAKATDLAALLFQLSGSARTLSQRR